MLWAFFFLANDAIASFLWGSIGLMCFVLNKKYKYNTNFKGQNKKNVGFYIFSVSEKFS